MAGEEITAEFWKEAYRMCKLLRLFDLRMTTLYFLSSRVCILPLDGGSYFINISLPRAIKTRGVGFLFILFGFVLLSCMFAC